MSTFTDRVLAAVRRIPAGRVATYGDIATLAGRSGAARAVGTIMRTCRARGVPCHRVVAAGGQIGGFGGAPGLKRSLLLAEGVVIRGDRIRDFRTRRWMGPRPRITDHQSLHGCPIVGRPGATPRSEGPV
jgi:O-6-methylguanine DNA methyltransferase